VTDGDVRISSRDPRVQENITDSVTPLPGVISSREELASVTLPVLPDPSVAAGGYRWADAIERRVDEVARPVRDRAAETVAARVNRGELVEVYQRITTAESTASASPAGAGGVAGPGCQLVRYVSGRSLPARMRAGAGAGRRGWARR
jgi:hypothetical protein